MTSLNTANSKSDTLPSTAALNPSEEGSLPGASSNLMAHKTKAKKVSITPGQAMEGVRNTINPPNQGNAFEKIQEAREKALNGLKANPSIPPKIVKLPGDRQVILQVRNNGGFFMITPNPDNPLDGRIRHDVPGITVKSTPLQIAKAVEKAASNPRDVEYVFDRGGFVTNNTGNPIALEVPAAERKIGMS